ncbi:MAG: site-2 protease family protein, partial [Gaiellaceae bacterium]
AGLRELRAAVGRADLSEPARRAAERGITEVEDGLSREAYWQAPTWKRVAVIFAGPGVNLVFAIVALTAVFMLGVPVEATRTVEAVIVDSPAARAGLLPGDRILAVGNEQGPPEELADAIKASEGSRLTVRIERDGRVLELRARPRLTEGDYRLGFSFGVREESYGLGESVGRAFEATWEVTKAIGGALGRIVTGSGRDEVASVVGITAVSSDAAEEGVVDFLLVLAFISLSLALLNLLPLLPLDGGHIAFSLAEWIRGRAIPREAYERVSAIGIAIVLFLFFIGLSNDIDRFRNG